MALFWFGPEFWLERILKLSSPGSKFYLNINFVLLSIIFFSLFWKKAMLSHSRRAYFRNQNGLEKYLEQDKEIKRIWKGAEIFNS